MGNENRNESGSVDRHEELLRVGTRRVDAGVVRARTSVESGQVSAQVERMAEELDELEHVAPNERDSGQVETLPDGSISIPILEEELVITKRVVVRERVILRKRVTTVEQTVEAELRRERVDVEVDNLP